MAVTAPVLLSLDTATDRIHAALDVGDVPVRARELPGGAQASEALLPALADMLGEAGCAWPDVDAVAFGCGPGAFTGLRTACSVAQGLALGLGIPVLALDTLMAVAEDARQADPTAFLPGDTLWVLQDARMGELYVGAYLWDGGQWQVSAPACLWPLDEPASRWAVQGAGQEAGAGALRWAGNAGVSCAQALQGLLHAQVRGAATGSGLNETSAPFAHAAPRGQALAALARAAWRRGETLDAALALPRYVRDKVAQTTAERAADKFRA